MRFDDHVDDLSKPCSNRKLLYTPYTSSPYRYTVLVPFYFKTFFAQRFLVGFLS